MKGRAFNLLAAISFLLFVAGWIFWLRSHFIQPFGEFIGYIEMRSDPANRMIRIFGIYSSHGRLGLGFDRSDTVPWPSQPVKPVFTDGRHLVWSSEVGWERYPFTREVGVRSWTGFDARNRTFIIPNISTTLSRGVAMPYGLPVLLTSILPAIAFWRHEFRPRRS